MVCFLRSVFSWDAHPNQKLYAFLNLLLISNKLLINKFSRICFDVTIWKFSTYTSFNFNHMILLFVSALAEDYVCIRERRGIADHKCGSKSVWKSNTSHVNDFIFPQYFVSNSPSVQRWYHLQELWNFVRAW